MHPVDIAAIARHSSINSQQPYIKDSHKRKGLRAIAVQQKPPQRLDLKVTPEKMRRRASFIKKKKPVVGSLSSPKIEYDLGRRDLSIPAEPALRSQLLNEADCGPIFPCTTVAPSVVASGEVFAAPSPSPFLLSNMERQELEWLRKQHAVVPPQMAFPPIPVPPPHYQATPRTYLQAAQSATVPRHRVMYDLNTGVPYIA